jgi:hypothetical protein
LALQACGPLRSFKRLITPANKPQGFGFAEYEDPESALRAMDLLQGVELPALEDGCANKKLLVCPLLLADIRRESFRSNLTRKLEDFSKRTQNSASLQRSGPLLFLTYVDQV